MSKRSRLLLVLLLVIVALIALLFARCSRVQPPAVSTTAPATPAAPKAVAGGEPASASRLPDEVLTPAKLTAPAEIAAGAAIRVEWSGPDNAGDFVTIVRPDAPASSYANYTDTRRGSPLEIAAPIEAGEWEIRYVTARSKTVLARAPLLVRPIAATILAPDEVVLGTNFAVTWTGPNHAGDYLTIVTKDAPDGRYQNYADTKKGSPLTLTALVETGDAEVRYMSGQGAKVLARRAIKVVAATVSLEAPAKVIAGSAVPVTWSGPSNRGDYLTIVPKTTPDGQYGNYTDVSKGSPLKVAAPMTTGAAELRYMTGQGAKVLARRPIEIEAARVSLRGPSRASPNTMIAIEWEGPNNAGDYLTIVLKSAKGGASAHYALTSSGSPAKVRTPPEAGACEIRYVSGQKQVVLARAEIDVQ